MSEKEREKTVEDLLRDVAPSAALVVVGSYIGWSRGDVENDPAAALKAVIDKMPDTGKIRGEKKRMTVKAMTWVLTNVPTDHAERDELAGPVNDLVKRA